MKRFGLALVVGAVSVLAISGSASAGGPYDSVSGAIKRLGINDSIERHFILEAKDGPQGPKGHYSATYGKGKDAQGYKGEVTCIEVVGNRAKVGIRIRESTRPDAVVGTYEILRVVETGNPSGDDQMDMLSPGVFTATPADCSGQVTGTTPTYSGNFSFNDAG